ncbi:Scr1 family TA system antitoxin-like transcriptional regulator [Streptomyces sp. NPDC004126]|uniref:Scr1 family TA system antitoxin-like transcriptional regulator n=1 Tax=Streptomyces sp. NPDC004126 TaxID=3390695 RepID=UPI003D07CD63
MSSTDYQHAREALGARLRELRIEAGLNGKTLAARSTSTWRGYETGVIPGLFQTPDYARHVFLNGSNRHRSPKDTEEAALRVLLCPSETMAGQLDRLSGLIGRDTVELGIIPLGAPMATTPKHGFWIYDERRVTVETISVELRLDSAGDVGLYQRVWDKLSEAAAYGPHAHRLIARARAALPSS